MRLVRFGDDVVAWAPAKVNLFLEILGKRPDGFHEINTLLLAIRLFDTLVVRRRPADAIDLSCNHAGLSTGPDNLVVRAARLLKEKTGFTGGVSIRLVKRIPMQAGLGGGSSDAAATLAALNEMWQLGLCGDELSRLGAELGSDVPFFFDGPAGWATGRGEQVIDTPRGRTLDLVVIRPSFGLATADVYRRVQVPAEAVRGEAIRQALANGDVQAIASNLHNRLQPAAESLAPALVECRQRIARLNPAGVLMSGSGSSVFALCRDRSEAMRIAQELKRDARESVGQVFVVRSC